MGNKGLWFAFWTAPPQGNRLISQPIAVLRWTKRGIIYYGVKGKSSGQKLIIVDLYVPQTRLWKLFPADKAAALPIIR